MCNVAGSTVSAFTLRYCPMPTDATIRALDARASDEGFRVTWQHNERPARTYALVEGSSVDVVRDLLGDATVFDTPIIALALRPNFSEALQDLVRAFGAAGAPAAVRGCTLEGDALVLEWDPGRARIAVLRELAGLELARTHAACTSELLCPLPLEVWTKLAAEGLHAPEIAPNRVLEALLEKHGVAS